MTSDTWHTAPASITRVIWACTFAQDFGTAHVFISMKPSMAENTGGPFPKLKGKAAETRHLGEALLAVWRDNQDATLRHHRMIERVLQLSTWLERHLDENADLLAYPVAMADAFLRKVCEYNATVSWLCNYFHALPDEAGRYFNYVCKNHYLIHGAYLSRWVNPIRTWCYQAWRGRARERHVWTSLGEIGPPAVANRSTLVQTRPASMRSEPSRARVC